MRGQRKKRGETKHLTVYLKYFKYKFQYLTAPADRKRSPDSTATTTDTESEYGSGKGTRGAGTQARRAEMIHRPSCCRPKTAMGPQKKGFLCRSSFVRFKPQKRWKYLCFHLFALMPRTDLLSVHLRSVGGGWWSVGGIVESAPKKHTQNTTIECRTWGQANK